MFKKYLVLPFGIEIFNSGTPVPRLKLGAGLDRFQARLHYGQVYECCFKTRFLN